MDDFAPASPAGDAAADAAPVADDAALADETADAPPDGEEGEALSDADAPDGEDGEGDEAEGDADGEEPAEETPRERQLRERLEAVESQVREREAAAHAAEQERIAAVRTERIGQWEAYFERREQEVYEAARQSLDETGYWEHQGRNELARIAAERIDFARKVLEADRQVERQFLDRYQRRDYAEDVLIPHFKLAGAAADVLRRRAKDPRVAPDALAEFAADLAALNDEQTRATKTEAKKALAKRAVAPATGGAPASRRPAPGTPDHLAAIFARAARR